MNDTMARKIGEPALISMDQPSQTLDGLIKSGYTLVDLTVKDDIVILNEGGRAPMRPAAVYTNDMILMMTMAVSWTPKLYRRQPRTRR